MTLHKPISVHAQKVESVEAAINAHEFWPLRELCFSCLFVSLAEFFQANCAAASQIVVIIWHDFLKCHIKSVNHLFILFELIVTVLLEALLNVFFDFNNLIIIKPFRVCHLEAWCLFWVLYLNRWVRGLWVLPYLWKEGWVSDGRQFCFRPHQLKVWTSMLFWWRWLESCLGVVGQELLVGMFLPLVSQVWLFWPISINSGSSYPFLTAI